MAKISIDKEKCIGCGACASTCPSNFDMIEGKAHVKNSNVKNLVLKNFNKLIINDSFKV